MEHNLSIQLEQNSKAKTLDFARSIFKSYGDVKIIVPIDDALQVYVQMHRELTTFSDEFDQAFVNRGLNNIKKNLLPRNAEHFLINAHASNVIKDIMNKYNMHIPVWLPETVLTEDKQAEHQKTCYFVWSTVNPCYIPHNMQGFMSMLLTGDIVTAPKQVKVEKSNISVITPKKKVVAKKEAPKPIDEANLAPEVEHGRFVAKKYLWLMDSANKRNLDFSISIEELSTLLREHVCYYSKEKLVSYPHEKGENNDHLPDNYLTIDRKDNELGYVSGNVVACSKSINTLKDQMSEDDFTQAMALKALVDKANLTPAQMGAFTSMMLAKA